MYRVINGYFHFYTVYTAGSVQDFRQPDRSPFRQYLVVFLGVVSSNHHHFTCTLADTVGLTHDYDQPEEVNVSEPQGVRGHAGAHFKGFEE